MSLSLQMLKDGTLEGDFTDCLQDTQPLPNTLFGGFTIKDIFNGKTASQSSLGERFSSLIPGLRVHSFNLSLKLSSFVPITITYQNCFHALSAILNTSFKFDEAVANR